MKISSNQRKLLIDILKKRDHELICNRINQNLLLGDSEITEIILILADEFCETGLKENDEPNERGIEIEDLIDVLNQSREM
jgi:hypothetical protein